MKPVNVIWKRKSPTDTKGYLRLSGRVGSKTKTKNLPLEPIEKRFFNTRTETVSKSHPKHEYYNNIIDKYLKEVEKKGNKLLLINDERRSFIEFLDKLIDRTSVPGTKQKYQNNRNLLVKFNQEVFNDIDIKFSDIDINFIEKYKSWLLYSRRNSSNTVSNKIKHFKSYVSKGVKEKLYFYDVNPFSLVKNKMIPTSIDILDKTDLEKLIKTPLKEVYRNKENFGKIITDEKVLCDPRYQHHYSLLDVKRFFLFCLFSQGLRISDLLTLRWNDFYIVNSNKEGVKELNSKRSIVREKDVITQIRIKKRMVKTKEYIDILVNYNTVDLLRPFIPVELLDEKTKKEYYDVVNTFLTTELNRNKEKVYDSRTKIPIVLDPRKLQEHNLNRFDFESIFYNVSVSDVDREIKRVKNQVEMSIDVIDVTEETKELNKRFTTNLTLKYLEEIKSFLTSKIQGELNNISSLKEETLIQLYGSFSKIIMNLSTDEKTKLLFCFPLLKNEDFSSIGENNDFSVMTEKQYTRFTGGRTYYNRLLKVVQQQCGINKKMTSHLSRHSYTSLMLQIGENIDLFDLMTSLGHKHLNTTQMYIQKFVNPKIDIMNKRLSDYLNNKKK